MMRALALLLVCAGLGPTAAFSNMPGQAERVETRALPTDTITVKSGAFCSNRICAGADCTSPQGLYKANSPLVSHKAESLQDCAAAVKNDPRCGNGFSYGSSDRYCDCPPVGEPCVVADWPWYDVYGFKVLPRAENDCDAPPSPPPPSPPPSCSIKIQGMGGAFRDSVTVEGTVDARTVPWNEWVPVFTEAYTGCAQSAARSRVLSLSLSSRDASRSRRYAFDPYSRPTIPVSMTGTFYQSPTLLNNINTDSWKGEMTCGGLPCTSGGFKMRFGDADGADRCVSSRTSEDDVYYASPSWSTDSYTYTSNSASTCKGACFIPDMPYDLEDDVCQVWVYITSCGD